MNGWHLRLARAAVRLLLLGFALSARTAGAHEMSMAELELREISRGQFLWSWGENGSVRPIADALTLLWPEGCRAEGQALSCPPRGMLGRLSVDGVGKQYSAVIARIAWLNGQTRAYTLTSAQPSVYLQGGADDSRAWGEVASAYGRLGVEHILSGVDHLLFVLGLLFLVGFRRRLLGAPSAFTLAHSLTLACSVLGWIRLRPAPVEAAIALSIVLVASEALRERETLARRAPALVAFTFGLVHGLGFAGALTEIGLPSNHLAVPLVTFNLGVEFGQLLTVLAAYGVTRAFSRQAWFARARQPALFVIGVVASFWSWQRLAALGL